MTVFLPTRHNVVAVFNLKTFASKFILLSCVFIRKKIPCYYLITYVTILHSSVFSNIALSLFCSGSSFQGYTRSPSSFSSCLVDVE